MPSFSATPTDNGFIPFYCELSNSENPFRLDRPMLDPSAIINAGRGTPASINLTVRYV
jgi:hypothetical protein